METHLTIKHLAGYLPYGLNVIDEEISEKFQVAGFNVSNNEFLIHDNIDGSIEEYSVNLLKPILRPLSDLTKEIEVNGEKFFPIEKLNNDFRPNSKDLNVCMFANEISIDIDTEDYSQCIDLADGFRISEKLHEWHFDIYGLIENNLAIDKNTIK